MTQHTTRNHGSPDPTTDVLVVGAGPTGLTLAVALGRLGVRCLVVERGAGPGTLPKMELCNPRTMEIYRALGLADTIRAAGWPEDAPMDSLVLRRLADPDVLRIRYPSSARMRQEIAAHNDGSRPSEGYQRISQYTLEPILLTAARAAESVRVHFGQPLESLTQDPAGVTAVLAGAARPVRARFLVGCDGANSTVRDQLGITMDGHARIARLMQVFFRSDDLPRRHRHGTARHYSFLDPGGSVLISQDDLRHYSLHTLIGQDEDATRIDPVELVTGVCGFVPELTIRHAAAWEPHLLVADRFQRGRVFLAGDAAHQYPPSGGLGMNTGIGDAHDLAWKLAATVHGWAGPGLLASYEAERRPVALRNRDAAAYAALGGLAWRGAVREAGAPDGVLTELGALIEREQRKSHELAGAELGYRYRDSPVCWPDDVDDPPPDDPDPSRYTPSTAPGCRLPHVRLPDGRSVHDHIGPGLTLLGSGPNGTGRDVDAITDAARRIGVPVRFRYLPDDHVRQIYGHNLLLVRPDHHVAWRGNCLSESADTVLARVTGRPFPTPSESEAAHADTRISAEHAGRGRDAHLAQ